MNPAGLVVIALGVVVVAQVTAGHALDRLGVTSGTTSSTAGGAAAAAYTAPADPGLTSTRPKVAAAPQAVAV